MSSSLWGRQFKTKCQERHRIKTTHKTSKIWKITILIIWFRRKYSNQGTSTIFHTYSTHITIPKLGIHTFCSRHDSMSVSRYTMLAVLKNIWKQQNLLSLFLCHSYYVSFLLLGAKSSIQFSQKQVLHIASNDHMARNQMCE